MKRILGYKIREIGVLSANYWGGGSGRSDSTVGAYGNVV